MKALFALVLLFAASSYAHEIALVQYNADIRFGDYEANMKALQAHAEQAVAHGSKIIVFPEGSTYGYVDSKTGAKWCSPDRADRGCVDVRNAAEPIPGGRTSAHWEAFAKKHQVFVLFNIPEDAGNQRYFNTTAAFGPEGFVTLYRKRELYTTDTFYASPGDLGPVTLETPYGNFGLLICMDANYDSYYQQYKKLGLNRLIIPMDWDQDPNGGGGARPARIFFQKMARKNGMDLFVSDVSPWDGTGAYYHNGTVRERNGLAPIAVGVDGVSYHRLN